MSGSHHALVLTSKYATPTSYVHNSVLCWTKTTFKVDIENDKRPSLYTQLAPGKLVTASTAHIQVWPDYTRTWHAHIIIA